MLLLREGGELEGDLLGGVCGELAEGAGTETLWILPMAYQSAPLIRSYSLGFGGRQQPGQPGFFQAASAACIFGWRFAH